MGANALTINTDAISLGAAISGASTLTIAPKTATTTIGLGSATTGTLNLDDTELGYLSNGFSSITFGSASATGKITAGAFTYSDYIRLYNYGSSSSGIEFIGAFNTGSDNLTLYTTGTVTQGVSGSISAAGLELLGTGASYTLTNSGNAITTLAGSTGSVSFLENSGFAIGTVNTVGLTTTGNTKQGLLLNAFLYASDQLPNGFGLITRWFVIGYKLKFHASKLPN